MTGMPKVKVHLTAGGGGTVEVDGVALKCVSSIAIEASRDATNVVLRIACPNVELTAEDAEVVARYLESPKDPVQPTLNPDAPNVRSLIGLIVEAMKREFPWLAKQPVINDVRLPGIPRRTLDARGPTDGVGRISFER